MPVDSALPETSLKHWQELGQILDRVLSLARSGHSAALATVTAIRGSAYRRPGARLLIEPDGGSHGGVSGGCLEEDVREVGLQVIRTGRARLLHYETGGDDSKVWGLGLGCDGAVDIAVQPIAPDQALGVWARVRGSLHFFDGCGHFWPHERPRETAEVLERFWRERG